MSARNLALTCLIGSSLSAGGAAADKNVAQALPSEQWIEFRYEVQIPALTQEQLPLQLFVPVAPSNDQQTVLTRDIKASDPKALELGRFEREATYGNEYWTWTINEARPSPSSVSFVYKVLRRTHEVNLNGADAQYAKDERKSMQRYLMADRRVPIEGELVSKLRTEIPKTAKSPQQKAKAIYNYVVDNMEYKKVGSGWGNGDTYWACSQKYGNCTDFHALYTSMSRAEGIPTKFAIGFPIPQDKPQGDISGYHCWLEAYLPGVAWTPIDASEAKKHPEQREFLFGSQGPDRILFTVGRDLVLGEMQGKPINFFVYPHVLHKGQELKDLVKTKFSYQIFKAEDLKVAL